MSERILKGGEYLTTEVTKNEVFTPEDFTDEHKQIAETTEQFISSEVLPHKDRIENQDFEFILELMRKCGELGLLMIDVPEAYGGLELDKTTSMLVADRMSPSGSFSVTFSAHTGIGTLPLVYYGTEAQKEKYLEKLTTGEMIAAYCLTEPGYGSDALGGQTSAILSDDKTYYTLNGTKQFITNAGFAELFTVFAKVDKEHFTGFLVERAYEGVSIGPEEKKMGIRGSSTCQVILENVKVPVENLLGEIGKGHKIALNVLNVGRFKLGAGTQGASKVIFGEAVKYANERKQFGQTIGSFGAIQEKIADMTAKAFASESLVYRIAGMLDAKLAKIDKSQENYYELYQRGIEEYAAECAIAKVFCSERLSEIADEVVAIFGGYGFIQDYPAEGCYRDERINRIFEGTNEINRLLTCDMIFRKAMKNEIPLLEEAGKVLESLSGEHEEPLDEKNEDGILFAKEKMLLKRLKKLFLIITACALRKYMDKLRDEQEVLLAMADIAIWIFAAESAVLRADKIFDASSDKKKEQLGATVKCIAFLSAEKINNAARKAAFFLEEGDELCKIIKYIAYNSRYDATGLLEAKRSLARAALEAEKYVF